MTGPVMQHSRPGGTRGALVDRVRQRLIEVGAPATPAGVLAAVAAEPAQAPLGGPTLLRLTDRLYGELAGAGPLTDLLADPRTTDVMVNGPDEVWVDQGVGMTRSRARFDDVDAVRRLAQRLAAACGRRLDDGSPWVDAWLPDGTRLHAVLPPIAVRGPHLSLRTLRHRALSLDDLVATGSLPDHAAHLLHSIVHARLSYVVSGGAGTGKTTLLATMLGLVPADERIVVVEDATELRPNHPHVVSLQARLSNVEGVGAVGLRELVRQALRMRPDRLVVGECRGAEVVDLLGALNTGHDGGASTLHANSALDVPARLEALGLLGGVSREALHAQVAAGLQVVLQLRRHRSARRLEEICLLVTSAGMVQAQTAWRRSGGAGPAGPALVDLLADRGVAVPPDLAGILREGRGVHRPGDRYGASGTDQADAVGPPVGVPVGSAR